jgi:hypothetical protein
MAEFDIDRFVSLSKAVDLSDIDWKEAARIGITDDEFRVLRFMCDTELHTILYLRDLLAGHSAADPEVTQFMACWVYEETHHGRALERFCAEAGRPMEKDRFTTVNAVPTFREEFTGVASRAAARLTPHFAAAHMCWGAINEMMAAMSYMALARHTKNTQLAKLVSKLARDERKHFAFYYSQAERRLTDGGWKAQALCRFTIQGFWEPVGIGVGEPNTLEFISSFIVSDEEAIEDLTAVDTKIAQLPGMSWFTKGSDWINAGRERYRAMDPAGWARHRALDTELAAARGKAPDAPTPIASRARTAKRAATQI